MWPRLCSAMWLQFPHHNPIDHGLCTPLSHDHLKGETSSCGHVCLSKACSANRCTHKCIWATSFDQSSYCLLCGHFLFNCVHEFGQSTQGCAATYSPLKQLIQGMIPRCISGHTGGPLHVCTIELLTTSEASLPATPPLETLCTMSHMGPARFWGRSGQPS